MKSKSEKNCSGGWKKINGDNHNQTFSEDNTINNFSSWLDKETWTEKEAAFLLCGYHPNVLWFQFSSKLFEPEQLEKRYSECSKMLCSIREAKLEGNLFYDDEIIVEELIILAFQKRLPIRPELIQAASKKFPKLLDLRKEGSKKSNNKFSEKEKNSLLKMIIGMAVSKYGHDSKKQRNKSTTEIFHDMEKLGIFLDQDTITKWLKEAAAIHLDQSN